MLTLFCSLCGCYFPSGASCPKCATARVPLETPTAPDKPVWKVQVPGAVAGQMAPAKMDGQDVVVVPWSITPDKGETAKSNGGITIVRLSDGEPIWERAFDAATEGGAAVMGDALVVGLAARGIAGGAGDGSVVALNLRTRQELWAPIRLDGAIRSAPVIDDMRIFVTVCDGKLYCFDLRNGPEIWSRAVFERPVQLTASPVLHRERNRLQAILVATYSAQFGRIPAKLVAFDPQGTSRWSPIPLEGNARGTPIVAGHMVYVTSYAEHPSRGILQAIDIRNGALVWNQAFVVQGQPGERTSQNFSASPLVQDGVVYVGSLNHSLYAVDASNGQEKWKHDIGSGIATAPAWVEGLVIVGANDGNIYALDAAKQGERVWQFSIGAPVRTNPLVWQDFILVGAQNGALAMLPWHGGQYTWAAERLEQKVYSSRAAECHALAAHFSHYAAVQSDHSQRAMQDWIQDRKPELAARFLEAQMWATPDQVGRAYQDAADAIADKNRALAARLLFQAAEFFDEVEMFAEAQQCERRATKLGLAPRLILRCVNLERYFEPDEYATLIFELKNRGSSEAQVTLRLGGVIAHPVKLQDPFSIMPGGVSEIELGLMPTGRGTLTVEVFYEDANANHWHVRKEFVLNVRDAPQVLVGEDAGTIIMKNNAGENPTRVRVNGMVGMLKIETA